MELHNKGWGYELWIHNDEKYCGKLLHFNNGKKCSFHYHIKKYETFYINSGSFRCKFIPINDLSNECNYKDIILSKGDFYEIPPNLVHEMEAIDGNAEIIEFSTQHFEDDSYRIRKGD
jgi:mannose-6-phosphate isomerase-like protein (cupin superfamily)